MDVKALQRTLSNRADVMVFVGWVLSKILEPFNIDDRERAQDAFTIFNALVKAVSSISPFLKIQAINIH